MAPLDKSPDEMQHHHQGTDDALFVAFFLLLLLWAMVLLFRFCLKSISHFDLKS